MIVFQNIVLSQTMWILDQHNDKKITLVIDSDMESENETHNAEEYSFHSIEEWIEDNISWKSEDFTSVSGVPIECYNPQSVSEITISFLAGQNKNPQPHALVSAKIPWSIMRYDVLSRTCHHGCVFLTKMHVTNLTTGEHQTRPHWGASCTMLAHVLQKFTVREQRRRLGQKKDVAHVRKRSVWFWIEFWVW